MSKISELSDGGSLQSTDYLIAVRSGGNVKVQADGNLTLGTVTLDGLSVGTSTQNETLVLGSADSGSNFLQITNSTTTAADNRGFYVGIDSNENARIIQRENADMFFSTNNTEVMTLDASGNVGIGTTSPSFATGTGLEIQRTTATATLRLEYTGSNAFELSSEQNTVTYNSVSSKPHVFEIGSAEVARIDSSGNLLVGTTNAVPVSDDGAVLGASGYVYASRDGDIALFANRLNSDGDIAVFRKDGTTVGSIGSANKSSVSRLMIGTGETNLYFFDTDNTIYPVNSNGTDSDADTDLGASGVRFKDIYRSGSTISTSDRNAKQDERPLTEAEASVAQACKGLLKAFRFIDAVEKDGDGARIHFGIIAQDLQAAFEAEGLDANRYAMFRPSTFTDDEGNEQTRLGVCYENLLAFIIAAL